MQILLLKRNQSKGLTFPLLRIFKPKTRDLTLASATNFKIKELINYKTLESLYPLSYTINLYPQKD